VMVRELPIGYWTNDYKEALDGSGKLGVLVHSFENLSSEKEVLFRVRIREEHLERVRADPLKELDLVRVIHTNNMHAFDHDGNVRRYEDSLHVLREFCAVRRKMYAVRKSHLMRDMRASFEALAREIKFVRLVVDGELVVFKRRSDEVLADMQKHGLEGSDELLRLPITRFTQDHVEAMLKKQQSMMDSLASLEKKTAEDLWMEDLSGLA
jgi:DNA topoisomerase II